MKPVPPMSVDPDPIGQCVRVVPSTVNVTMPVNVAGCSTSQTPMETVRAIAWTLTATLTANR